MKNAKKSPLVRVIWELVLDALKANPVILVPFFISGILKLLCLLVIFLSIFPPLSVIFAPLIRALWGEGFLHYPFNFYLMPKIFYYAHIAVYILLDGLMSGIAVWMVHQTKENKKPRFSSSLRNVLPHYVTLAVFLSFIFMIVYFINFSEGLLIPKLLKLKFVTKLQQEGILNFLIVFLNFFLFILIETLFAFVIPFVVLEGKKFFGALKGSLVLVKKLFFATFGLIVTPTLLLLPFSLLKSGLPILIDKTLPEITFLVLGGSVVATILIDCVVTTSLAFLFLSRKDLNLDKN
ncbi:hypothetical protein ACFL0P_06290 [Candidatus Omnitrophota bacterium]